jgi:hypothetical protein
MPARDMLDMDHGIRCEQRERGLDAITRYSSGIRNLIVGCGLPPPSGPIGLLVH